MKVFINILSTQYLKKLFLKVYLEVVYESVKTFLKNLNQV